MSEVMQVKIKDIRNLNCKINGKGDKERQVFFTNECIRILEEYLEEQIKSILSQKKPSCQLCCY